MSGSKSLRTNSPFGRGTGQAPSPEVRPRCTPQRPEIQPSTGSGLPNPSGAMPVGCKIVTICRRRVHRVLERNRVRESSAFAEARLGPITLRNRIIKAATFEGRTPRRVVTDELIAFHRQVAAGGVGMTTVAYCAVDAGRQHRWSSAHARQSRDRPGSASTHRRDPRRRCAAAAASSGTRGRSRIPRARSIRAWRRRACSVRSECAVRMPSPTTTWRRSREQFADGAAGPRRRRVRRDRDPSRPQLSARARSSRRSSIAAPMHWGGSLEHRARFPRQVVRAVRDAVGDRVAVTAKLNMADGVDGGLWLEESIEVARMLERRRCARRAHAHRRELVREPDVPLPRRSADPGDGRDVPGRVAARASSCSPDGSSASTRSRRRTSSRTRGSSGPR